MKSRTKIVKFQKRCRFKKICFRNVAGFRKKKNRMLGVITFCIGIRMERF